MMDGERRMEGGNRRCWSHIVRRNRDHPLGCEAHQPSVGDLAPMPFGGGVLVAFWAQPLAAAASATKRLETYGGLTRYNILGPFQPHSETS